MPASVLIWGTEPADQYLAGRAARLVSRALPAVVPLYVPLEQLGPKLLASEGPVWVLRAGAWPADAARLRLPPPSATGLPLLAWGANHSDLNAPLGASVYLEAALARALGEKLVAARVERAEAPALQTAIKAVREELAPRVVRFAPLDVHCDQRLRVLQVVTSLQRGGAERVALDLALALPQRGVPCRIATIGGPTRESFAIQADFLDLSAFRGDRGGRAAALGAAAAEFGADVVHAHLIDADDAARISDLGLPLVMTIHNQRPAWPLGLAELPARGAALLVACSQMVERELRADRLASPIRTVWNGIDFDAAKPTPQTREAARNLRKEMGWRRNDFVLLALANPRPQKRQNLLPAVLAATRAQFSHVGSDRQVRLLFCGEHRQGNAVALEAVAKTQVEIDRLKLQEHVHWLGSVADVASVLAACDVLVSTSAYEGLSLAQVEALAAGLPIVITDVGGTADIAANNLAVTVIPLEAPAERYAAALFEIDQRRPAGGDQAARRDFTHTQMADRYAWLYPRAIAAARRRGPGAGLWLVTNNFSTGGAQSSARRLLTALAQQGVPVRAAVLEEQQEHPTPGRQALVAAGIRVVALPPPGVADPATAVAELLAQIDADPPAAVLCWNALAEYKVLLAEGLLDIPLFDVSPGEMYFTSLDRYFTRPRPALPYRTPADYGQRLAGLIVKYAGEAERARAALGCPVYVVPNGIELDSSGATTGLPSPARAVLTLGTSARLSPQKKLEELFAALRKAHGRLPPYVLRIAGGPERGSEAYAANLRQLAQGLPVEWLGELVDVRSFLRDLDLFVMISEPAGCPNASLEALAAGLPVVATDFGGAREQIEHGVSGLLTPRGDAAALADAIVAAARDPALRQRLSLGGRARIVEHFSLSRMVADYRRICLTGQISQ